MKKVREVYVYILAALILAGYFILIGAILAKAIPSENKDLANMMFGTLTVMVVMVVKFFFDGNKETAAKNEMIYKSTPPPSELATTEIRTETTSTTEPEIRTP